jgi:hypothetical protein
VASAARYFDGRTAEVHEVSVRTSASDLVMVRLGDSSIAARWPFEELMVLGDTEHEAVPPVARRGEDARLMIEDAETRRQLALLVPQLQRLAAPAPAVPRRIAQFGATLLAIVGLFWLAVDFGSEEAADLVPQRLQAKLGESVFDELIAGEKLCKGEAGLDAINGIANRLAHAAGYEHEIKVYVVKGGPINAFTLPGGILVFYSDLITKAKNSSQVAGVLAHEIGHVVHNHPMKGLARQFGLELVLQALTGGYSDVGSVASGGSLLLALRNGRGFERQADTTGVALLEKLGMRADGVSSFFEEMMKDQPRDMAAAIGIWSSHPPTAERIASTRRPATGRPPFTDAEWKALREVCN